MFLFGVLQGKGVYDGYDGLGFIKGSGIQGA